MKKSVLLALLLGLSAATHAESVFIANPTASDPKLTAEDAQNILLGNLTKWRSGPIIKLVLQYEGAAHEQVIKNYTQRTADQFDKFWTRRVFTGNGESPTRMKTDAEVVAYVAANPGAFGYVDRSSTNDKVRVYPLP